MFLLLCTHSLPCATTSRLSGIQISCTVATQRMYHGGRALQRVSMDWCADAGGAAGVVNFGAVAASVGLPLDQQPLVPPHPRHPGILPCSLL